jgi:tetratricopeptide (TPR) repeat protein
MNKKKQQEHEIEENELVSWLEEKVGHLRPYYSQILLGICLVVLAGMAIAFFMRQAQAREAAKWQTLAIAQGNYMRTLDNTSLTDFADQYPDDKAGLWALLYAADAEMRAGLSDFTSDRKAGFDKITKAQNYYKRIVDSPVSKSTMLQRRSLFGLAYAYESSGDFDQARDIYQQIVELGDETPFAEDAARGLKRSTDPQYAALFEKFRDYADAPETAPGVRLPQRPDISFPGTDSRQPDIGGGDFGVDAEPNTGESPETGASGDESAGDSSDG